MRAPIPISLSTKKSRDSNSFSKKKDRAGALRGRDERDAHEIGGEARPDRVLELRHVATQILADATRLSSVDDETRALDARNHTQALEAEKGGAQVMGSHPLDGDRRIGDGREADEGTDLDVVGADGELGPGERSPSFDGQDIGADALNLGAHLHEQIGEVLDVGLARRIAQDGPSFRRRGGHEGVLGTGDARFVEEDVVTVQLLRLEIEGRADIDGGAQALEGEEMSIHPAPSDHVAPGGR